MITSNTSNQVTTSSFTRQLYNKIAIMNNFRVYNRYASRYQRITSRLNDRWNNFFPLRLNAAITFTITYGTRTNGSLLNRRIRRTFSVSASVMDRHATISHEVSRVSKRSSNSHRFSSITRRFYQERQITIHVLIGRSFM